MRYRYSISIFVPGMPFTGKSLEEHSLGGSESAAIAMARELAKQDNWVKIFCNCPEPGEYDNVTYFPIEMFEAFSLQCPHDINIIQRAPRLFNQRFLGKVNYLWCHDQALGRQREEVRSNSWNIDRFIVLSDYMKENYKKVYSIPDDYFFITTNGLDLYKFPSPNKFKRDRKRLVYSARPERGLDILLDDIAPILFEKDPEITISLYGYDNPVDHLREFYSELAQKAKRFGDKVNFIGYLPKAKLYEEYSKSGLYIYPTPSHLMPRFNEINCISVLESQASGMPIVTSARGALMETVGKEAGTLIKGDSTTEEYRTKFVDAVLSYINNDALYEKASKAGRKHTKSYSWDTIAEKWLEDFDRTFVRLNDNKTRLAYHFYRRSDIFAAKKVLKNVNNEQALKLKKEIDDKYSFAKSGKTLLEHYKKGGLVTDTRLNKTVLKDIEVLDSKEKRFHTLASFLNRHKSCKKILDFGCGHGWSTVFLHGKVGRKWVGLDFDPNAIKWAKRIAKVHSKTPKDMLFIVGDETRTLTRYEPFDCVIASDVLEHCIDPRLTLERIEKFVKKTGWVVLTVPHGPSEFATPNWETFRNHLWEFDYHDLWDMLEGKPELFINAAADHVNEETGEVVGYYLIAYKANHTPIKPINWDRKLKLQKPRQTVSTNIIAGRDAELTLRWCLDSIKYFADEIIVGDTGLNEIAKQIIKEYNCKIVEAPDPLKEGFDEARNAVLKHSAMDWTFIIDTDEKLTSPGQLSRYIKESMWYGLSVKQDHFFVDGTVNYDLPVRLFRNRSFEGKRMKIIGRLHEHPELKMNEGPGPVLVCHDCHLAHLGYLSEEDRIRKFWRNYPLLLKDQQDYPDRLLQKHFVMRDLWQLNMYELRENAGKITEEMKARAREIAKLYRENYLGKRLFANIDPLPYYSAALEILNEGITVTFSIGTNKDGQGDTEQPPVITARFLNDSEAAMEIDARIKEKMELLQTEDW